MLVERFDFGGVFRYDVGVGVKAFEYFYFFLYDGFEGFIDTDGDDARSGRFFRQSAFRALLSPTARQDG